MSEVAWWRTGPTPPQPLEKKKIGSDIQTDDDATHESRGYEKVCYSHDEALWEEQGQVSKLVWDDLSEGKSEWLWFLLWLGWGQRKVSMYRLGFVWFELPVQYQGKGRSVHTFLSACPDVKQKGKRKVEFESCQWSNVKNGARLSITVKLCCVATFFLPIPCPNDKISFLGDGVCFKLVDYNDFYLHNKIKIFPNS